MFVCVIYPCNFMKIILCFYKILITQRRLGNISHFLSFSFVVIVVFLSFLQVCNLLSQSHQLVLETSLISVFITCIKFILHKRRGKRCVWCMGWR